jgi:hypothetical protein
MFGKSDARRAAQEAQELEIRRTRARLAKRIQSIGGAPGEDARQNLRGHKRAESRTASYRVGSAMFDQVDSLSCRIVDQSYSGLRVVFNSEIECPDEFALTIPTLRFIGIVKTQWRNGREAGVSIVRWSDAA